MTYMMLKETAGCWCTVHQLLSRVCRNITSYQNPQSEIVEILFHVCI